MKKLLFAVLMMSGFSLMANATDPIKKGIDTNASKIEWVGKKITGQHSGEVSLKSGSLEFDGNALIGGEFTIDMTTISCTDLQGGGKDKLEGHLRSDDFFGVDNYPTADLTITKVTPSPQAGMYNVAGKITIKGKTQEIAFDAKVEGNNATANVVIDRTKFDIKYGSGSFFDNLGDRAINDEFELKINMVF